MFLRTASSALLLASAALLSSPSALAADAARPAGAAAPAAACPQWLGGEFRKLHSSQKVDLCRNFAGQPMLIVNTASHCGYTPQFKGLESVYQKYKGRGLAVVGFASDDFNQEAKDEAEAADTCFLNYGVTFTMLAPQHVKGPEANAVFRQLAAKTKPPAWNFNKYLVTADGNTVQHFDSKVAPDSPEFQAAIEKLLR